MKPRPYEDPEDIVVADPGAAPWPKACAECAFRRNDPQELGAEVVAEARAEVASGWLEFYCVHRRSERGLHRICACAAAIARRNPHFTFA